MNELCSIRWAVETHHMHEYVNVCVCVFALCVLRSTGVTSVRDWVTHIDTADEKFSHEHSTRCAGLRVCTVFR